MEVILEVGDYVRHRDHTVNNGLMMGIIDVTEDNQQAKCSFIASNGDHKEEWFDVNDLTLIHKSEGGFFE